MVGNSTGRPRGSATWRFLVTGSVAIVGFPVVLGVVVVLALAAPFPTPTSAPNPRPTSAPSSPSRPAVVPTEWFVADESAAATCPGLPWTVLAAIGEVETDFGQGGEVSPAGALGPMQFEPATFAAYDHPVPADRAPNPSGAPEPPSIWDLSESVYAAARYLCTNGGAAPASLPGAIFAYNHAWWYVREVLTLSAGFTP